MTSTWRQEEIQKSKILLQESRVMLKHSKTSFVSVCILQQCTRYYLVSQLKIKEGCSAFLVLFPAWFVLLFSSDQERFDTFCCLQLYLCWLWRHFLRTVYEHCTFSIAFMYLHAPLENAQLFCSLLPNGIWLYRNHSQFLHVCLLCF